jgi:hypothetical protein
MSSLLTVHAVCQTLTETTTVLRHCTKNIVRALSLGPPAPYSVHLTKTARAHPTLSPANTNSSTHRSRSWERNLQRPMKGARSHPLGGVGIKQRSTYLSSHYRVTQFRRCIRRWKCRHTGFRLPHVCTVRTTFCSGTHLVCFLHSHEAAVKSLAGLARLLPQY